MEPEFITYQKFNDAALANELTQLLDEHDAILPAAGNFRFDSSLVMSNAPIDYAVNVKSEDFERVNHLRKENEAKTIDAEDKDYHLFGFSDDELMEVIAKANQWSALTMSLPKKYYPKEAKT